MLYLNIRKLRVMRVIIYYFNFKFPRVFEEYKLFIFKKDEI